MANKAQVSEAPATTTETVKAFGKGKKKDKYFQPKSDKDTVPYNDVVRDGVFIPGLTEEQRIREGLRAPFQACPNFKKDDFERKEWKRVHSNRKGPTGGAGSGSRNEPQHTFLVHLKNEKKDPKFRTTIRYSAGQSELGNILKSLYDSGSVVVKTIYRGQTTVYNG